MFKYSTFLYICVVILLELAVETHLTFHESNNGFVDRKIRYFDGEVSNIHRELSALRYHNENEYIGKLQFEPQVLDFKHRTLGVPHSETVTLYNMDSNKTIDMISISGNTVHFHSSFFEDKTILPNSNTSFKVVFLGRQEGPVESTLFIHTSEGFMKYNVKAVGSFSTYKLRPIVGIKLPINSTFLPLIYLHNPYTEPIQITEIYSSGGDFHLELPSGQQEGPNDMWEIPSQETKAIIRVRFEAKTVQNHTAYVRIKLHNPKEILIIPLEVEVTDTLAVFHPQGQVDFGIGGFLDPPKEVNFCLFNPLRKAVRIHSVSTISKAIKAQYYNVRINPGKEGEHSCVHVGTLTVDWHTAWQMQDYFGKIIVKFRNGKNRTEIPYHISVLKGGLSYDRNMLTYFLNEKGLDLSTRSFQIQNDFDYPLRIFNVSFPFEAHPIFRVETYTPRTILPHKKETIFNIKIKNSVKKTNVKLANHIKISTNVSDLNIPLLSYTGKLKMHLPFKSKDNSLDVGLLGVNSKKDVYFLLTNPNPVTVDIKNIQSFIPMTQVIIHGCGFGDYKHVLLQVTFANLTECNAIKSKYYMVIKIDITTTQIEGHVWGDIQIGTPFENLSIPVQFKIAPGKLEIGPDRLVFDQCFPGKMCSHPLRVHSTFNTKMTIQEITTLPPDKRITATHSGTILPKTSNVMGYLFLNPDLQCLPECYCGLHKDTTASWLRTLVLSKYMPDFDLHLVNAFYNRYLNLTLNGLKKWQNFTLRMDTSEVKGHIFNSRVKMSWPSLLFDNQRENKSVVMFPLSQIGNYTYKNVTIYNPSSHNVVVHIILDKHYPRSDVIINGLPVNLMPEANEQYKREHGFFFKKTWMDSCRLTFKQKLNIRAFPDSVPILLEPGEAQELQLGFYTEDAHVNSALMFIRNNLTVLEVVRLKAVGSVPLFKFGNRRPGSVQPLLFEMTEKHMKDCEQQKVYSNPQPNLTVKRTFTVRNLGLITVYINSFHINEFACEGYGFKVIDCGPVVLRPNSTKKIDIAFTPDLTLTKVTRTLILGTSLSTPVNYTLYTTVPSTYLKLCTDLIMRPIWEKYLSYITLTFMFFLFFVIVFIAIIDSERIGKDVIDAFASPNSPSFQPVLDLRRVGQQTREEIQSTKEKKKDEETNVDQLVGVKDYNYSEESVKPKTESALIPTTGKAKKKMTHKSNGSEIGEVEEVTVDEETWNEKGEKEKETRPRKKDLLFERHRLKSKERRNEKEMKILQEKCKKDKHFQQKDTVKKPLVIKSLQKPSSTGYEEETSSTTTESSSTSNNSNYEEIDKEIPNDNSCTRQNNCDSSRRDKSQQSTDSSNHSTETSERHVSFINKPKLSQKVKRFEGQQKKDWDDFRKMDVPYLNQNRYIRYRSHNRDIKKRERKEKVFRNKNLERKATTNENGLIEAKPKSPINFYIPIPPPTTTTNSWGENRAKFSDVVAGNECISTFDNSDYMNMLPNTTNRPLSMTKPAAIKPTMYVEPYKPAELGPIGSQRMDHSDKMDMFDDTHYNEHPLLAEDQNVNMRRFVDVNSSSYPLNIAEYNPLNDESVIAAISSRPGDSFFSSPNDTPVDQGNVDSIYFDQFTDNWNKQQMLKNMLQSCEDTDNTIDVATKMDAFLDPWNGNLLNSSAYWNNGHLSLTEEAQTMPPGNSTNYLWGSNPIWQPWSPPEAPSTPRRTPPGFDDLHLNREIASPQEELQQRATYIPFANSGIWTQAPTQPWNMEDEQR